MDWSTPRAGSRSILRCLAISCCQKKLVSPDTGWEDAESDAMKPTRSGVFGLLARTLWLLPATLGALSINAAEDTQAARPLRLGIPEFATGGDTESLQSDGGSG